MSFIKVKDRSRQRLETLYSNSTPAITPLILGAVLIFCALFLFTSKTVFRCSKYAGDPSLNDICTYESTSILAGSSLARTILPSFITGTKHHFHFGYIESADIITHRHDDTEHHTVTYTYDVVLTQKSSHIYSKKELARRTEFFDSTHNLHYPEYNESTLSSFDEYPIYTGFDLQADAYRLAKRINQLLDQYRRSPQQPLFFEKIEDSWMDEIVLVIGAVLIVWASCLISVSESITLDQSNKTLVIISKSLFGFLLNTEFIPISQIVKFDIQTATTSTSTRPTRYQRRPIVERDQTTYSAYLQIKENNSTPQPTPHRITNPDGINSSSTNAPTTPLAASPTQSNDDVQQQEQPLTHNNSSYSPVVGEDGEYILMNQPSSYRPQPPPPPPLPRQTPQTRNIRILCGQEFGESDQHKVTEYVTLFQDWVNDYQRRIRMKEEEKEHILKLAEQALQRQIARETAQSISSTDFIPRSSISNDGMVNRHNRSLNHPHTTTSTTEENTSPIFTRSALSEINHFGDHNDEVIDETPEQTDNDAQTSQFGDYIEEVPTAPVMEVADIELTEQQISFLLRRRNQRLLNDRLENENENDATNPFSNVDSNDDIDNQNPSQGRVCCVCMDENTPVKTVLMPCKHLILCSSCSSACDKCPLCRTPIAYTINVFY